MREAEEEERWCSYTWVRATNRWWKAHLLRENRVGEDVALLLLEWWWHILAGRVDEDMLVVVHLLNVLHLKVFVIVEANHREPIGREFEAFARLGYEILPSCERRRG